MGVKMGDEPAERIAERVPYCHILRNARDEP